MAATVEIRSYHGASPDSGTDVAGGSVRFKQADNDTVDANNPIPIPTSGSNYSYIKNFRFYASTSPDNKINNMKFYTDGANGLGTGVGLNAQADPSYEDPIALADSGLVENMTDAFTYTSGSPMTVSGEINNPTTGAFGNYVQLQMSVGTSASQGTTGSETMTFSYDET